MIEIEIKFPLLNGNEQRILKNATPIDNKEVVDAYYDNATYDLTLKDYWLRLRDDKYELKIPANPEAHNSTYVAHRYVELTDDAEILKALGLSGDNLHDVLIDEGYSPIATFTTTRRSYEVEGFCIDIDHTDFGYSIGEIEKLIEDPSLANETEKELKDYLVKQNISFSEGHLGKVVHYLQKNKPEHFHALVEAGIIDHQKNKRQTI